MGSRQRKNVNIKRECPNKPSTQMENMFILYKRTLPNISSCKMLLKKNIALRRRVLLHVGYYKKTVVALLFKS